MSSRESADIAPGTAPEAPPEFDRRVSIPSRQLAGLALLIAVPLLALCGFLGDRIAVKEAKSAAGLKLHVESPACARYGNLSQMRIRVEGTPEQAGSVVRIEVATDYLERFSAVVASPAETGVEHGRLVFEQTLDSDARGAPWLFDLTPERYGWARGNVRVMRGDDGEDAATSLELATFVFP